MCRQGYLNDKCTLAVAEVRCSVSKLHLGGSVDAWDWAVAALVTGVAANGNDVECEGVVQGARHVGYNQDPDIAPAKPIGVVSRAWA